MATRTLHRLPRLALVFALVVTALGMAACDNVAVEPKGQAAADNIFEEDSAYKSYLARLYGGLNITGQEGPFGDPDIAAISDEGFSQYMRLYWQMQELPTDGAVIAFEDGDVQELNTATWSASNGFSSGMYSRVSFQVSHANEFLRESTEGKLESRNVGENVRTQIPLFRAEARFLRALSYWHGMDLFGDIPVVDESFPRGGQAPPQNARAEVFDFVESEMLAITGGDGGEVLPDPGEAEYGRADKAAAWMVLAKIYQNASVYIGEDRSSDVIEYTERILDAGYSLEPDYQHLFLADNHTADGLIFTIPNDGQRTQHFGGTQFLTHAPVGGSMDPSEYGIDTGYNGLRTTPATVGLFEEGDSRAIFYTDGQTLAVESLTQFTNGYAVPKYQNVTSNGVAGPNPTFPETDYPMFRLGDVYLMYAEAVLRGGGGDEGRALDFVNALRERAFGDGAGTISASELTLDFILDERGREMLWEGTRRMDLVRFGQFTGEAFLWSWKGGSQSGQALDATRTLYPLPASELLANPNLEQNPGY